MKLRTLSPVLLGLLLASCAGQPDATEEAASTPEMSPDEQALVGIAEAWQEHFNLGHASMVADLYVDESWQLNANGNFTSGRDEFVASLEETLATSPSITLTRNDMMVVGDMAAAWGSYAIEASPPDAEPLAYSGTYLTVFTKASGEWKIMGSLNNYDAPPPEGLPFAEPGEAPPDEGTMGDLIDTYVTHWNQSHASMVADLYTEDAVAAFANSPPLQGRAAIAADLEARMAEGASELVVHDVGTVEMGEGWAVDGGWYEIKAPDGGDMLQTGAYLSFARQQADGAWKIHWFVTNGRTADQM